MNWCSRILAFGAAATVLACGGGSSGGGGSDGDPLAGTWVDETTGPDQPWRYTFTLEANGKANVEQVEVSPPAGQTCSGTSHFDDLKWSHTKTTLTVAGSNCSGKMVCRDESTGYITSESECYKPPRETRFILTYSLSADEDTLDVSEFQIDKVTLGPATFVRMK